MRPEVVILIKHGAGMVFYVLLLIFIFHAIFLAYHWFSYGTSRQTSLIALVLYVTGGAILFLTFALYLQTI